jgi:hypothetical protein
MRYTEYEEGVLTLAMGQGSKASYVSVNALNSCYVKPGSKQPDVQRRLFQYVQAIIILAPNYSRTTALLSFPLEVQFLTGCGGLPS